MVSLTVVATKGRREDRRTHGAYRKVTWLCRTKRDVVNIALTLKAHGWDLKKIAEVEVPVCAEGPVFWSHVLKHGV